MTELQIATRTSRRRALAFHLGGLVLTALAGAASLIAAVAVSFATSTCDYPVPAANTRDLRVGLGAIGSAATAVPALWALWGRHRDEIWQPWAALAVAIAVLTVVVVVTTDVAAGFCLY